MDSNTMYAASMVGGQDDYNDYIVKQVWEDTSSNFSNMTIDSAQVLCNPVADKQGSSAYGRCMDAANGCREDETCNTAAKKYAKALAKGYKGSFADFKKRSSNLAAAGAIASDLLGGILSQLGGGQDAGAGTDGRDDYNTPPPPPKKKIGLYIALGAVALIGIGTAIYFARKK